MREDTDGLSACESTSFQSPSRRLGSCNNPFCALNIQIYKFLENAKTLVAYKHYFVCALAFALLFCVVWVAHHHGLLKLRHFGRAPEEITRSTLVILMFDAGMLFYAVMNTVKAVEKAYERVYECFGDKPDQTKWEELGEKLEHLSEGRVFDVIMSCSTIWDICTLEIVIYWVFSLTFAIAMTTWVIAVRARRLVQRERRLVGEGHKIEVMPMESVMRRSSIFNFQVYRGAEFEQMPLLYAKLLTANDFLTSFSFDLVSFFCLQKFQFPFQAVSWFPWKLLWEVVITSIAKGIFSRILASTATRCRKCGLLLLGVSIFLHSLVILTCWIMLVVTLWSFWDSGFGLRLLRALDIAVGVGFVGCLLTPLSVELMFAFTSAFIWEPRIRHLIKRRVVLRGSRDVARFSEALADEDSSDCHWFGDEYVSSSWVVADVTNTDGLRLDEAYDDEDKLDSFADLADADYPVTVHLNNRRAGPVVLFVVGKLGDAFFGVDESLPVKPLKFNKGCCGLFSDHDRRNISGESSRGGTSEKAVSADCVGEDFEVQNFRRYPAKADQKSNGTNQIAPTLLGSSAQASKTQFFEA